MKKSLILLFSLALLTGCSFTVNVSSGSAPAASSEPESSVPSESQPAPSSESQPVSSESQPVSSESAPAESSSSSAQAEWIDYAHNGSVKLGLDYIGADFFKDGVAKVSLYNTIDGDTAHFKDANGNVIKSRFYGIDTPESTGKIQAYGGKASKYTANILNEAEKNGTIVVSSAQEDYGVPQPDSTGSRYVSLIWVNLEKKDAAYDELYLLNLMIVQDGLSWVKNVGDMPEYVDTFYAAERQAKAFKLMLHSGEPDDEMPTGDYEIVSLLDLKKTVIAGIEATKKGEKYTNPFDNKKVRLQGTVNGFSNHILYLSDFCYYLDEEGNPIDDSKIEVGVTGEYASINVFCGMSVPPSKFTTLGNYIEVCGVAKDSKFGFQITDVELPISPYNDNDGKLILKAAANTEEHALHIFEYTADELQAVIDNEDWTSLNCRITMTTPLECTKIYKDDNGNMTMYFEKPYSFRPYFVFKFKPYPVDKPNVTWTQEDQFVGQKFTVSGIFTYHESAAGNISMQIYPSTSADLVLVQEAE